MPGAVFVLGENKIRPGMYVRTTNATQTTTEVGRGIVAALFKSSWGPLGLGTLINAPDDGSSVYGSSQTADLIKYVVKGKAKQVLPFRMGTGGTKATLNLQDTTEIPVNAVKIDALYVGTDGNNIKLTVRDSLTDPALRELLVYYDTALVQTIPFTKGAIGDGEPKALYNAIVAAGSSYIASSFVADGTKILATITQQPLTTGADPTTTGTELSDALTAIEAQDWNVLVTDSEDNAIHSTIEAYIDRVISEGKYVLAAIGEKTSVAFDTRMSNCAAFNDLALHYVANGFKFSDGTEIEGYKAAGYVAGRIAAAKNTDSLTHDVVDKATEIIGALTEAQIKTAIKKGALVFTLSARKQIQIEYGINTLTTLSSDQDAGWKKIRRVITRFDLIQRIAYAWDALIGKVDNNTDGAGILIGAANGVIGEMIKEGSLQSGSTIIDPEIPQSGDSSWFKLVDLVDNDSSEKMYLTIGFQYGTGTVTA